MDETASLSRGAALVDQLGRFKPKDLSLNAWAVRAGVGRTVWTDMRRHGNPSRRTLAKLLSAVDSSLAEFEALAILEVASLTHAAPQDPGVGDANWGWKGAPLLPLPTFACRSAGTRDGAKARRWSIDRSAAIDHLPRPPSLAGDAQAYALVVPDAAMEPRLRRGRRIAISPQREPRIGDDVLVVLSNDRPRTRVVPGNLQSRDGDGISILQFGCGDAVHFAGSDIRGIQVIAGELI